MARSPTRSKRPDARPSALPAPVSAGLPRAVTVALRRVGARQLRMRFIEGALWLAAALPALALGQALADWAFNLPWIVRLLLLLGDVAAVGYLGYKFFYLPWQRRLTHRTAALLVEREMPGFRSGLISAVELSDPRPGSPPASPALVRLLVAGVSAQVQALDLPRRVVKTPHLGRRVRAAAVALVLAGGAAALFPDTARVLAERSALFHVALPSRTSVIPVSKDGAVALGADYTLSAKAGGVVPRSGRVFIVYANRERAELSVSPQPDDPRAFTVTLNNVQQAFTYHFALGDGTGEDYRVDAVVPPALESCRFVQRYPAYTNMKPAEMSAGNLSLLAGSRVQVEGRATVALGAAAVQLEGVAGTVALETAGGDKRAFRGEFAVPKEGLTGFSVALTDTHGVASKENTVYRVDLLPDKVPVVELTRPRSTKLSVVMSSRPALEFSAKDDFGLSRLTLRYEVEFPAPPGGETPPGQNGEIPLPPPGNVPELRQTFAVDLSKLRPPLVIGSTVRYWIEAVDNNDVTGPGVGVSERKTFFVLTEEAMKSELTEILGNKARDIDGIYSTQKKLNDDVDATLRKDHP